MTDCRRRNGQQRGEAAHINSDPSVRSRPATRGHQPSGTRSQSAPNVRPERRHATTGGRAERHVGVLGTAVVALRCEDPDIPPPDVHFRPAERRGGYALAVPTGFATWQAARRNRSHLAGLGPHRGRRELRRVHRRDRAARVPRGARRPRGVVLRRDLEDGRMEFFAVSF
jgi:hypothetical protein